ncbi:MAG: radical SAM/SPASM domain-containing protein [Candidatus Brocadiia bacterium]
MSIRDFICYFLPRIARYRASRRGWMRPGWPVTLTFSVTNLCQSKCKTCKIWQRYRAHPAEVEQELSLEEIEKLFASIRGRVYFLNISGGEPACRKDLPEIIRAALVSFRPHIVHVPTNAIAPNRIEQLCRRTLGYMDELGFRGPFTVKPSLDGVGSRHDEIRGVPGNFDRVLETVERLKALREDHPRLHVELGTVISRFNLDHVDEIAAFVQQLDVDNYRNEIAEQRAEFFNIGDPITPSAEDYEKLMQRFKATVREDLRSKRRFARITQAFRFVYYDLVGRIIAEERQVIPCYGGISNAHLSAHGEVWPCCVLGDEHSMGNVRNHGYDFAAVWNSPRAQEVRQFIRDGGCACPLANQAYSNILCHGPSLLKVFREVLR